MKKLGPKGCLNENCKASKEQRKYKDDEDYCPKCGSELIYVCKSKDCYRPLPRANTLKGYCDECLEKQEYIKEKRAQERKQVANVVKSAPAAVAAVISAAAAVIDFKNNKLEKKIKTLRP